MAGEMAMLQPFAMQEVLALVRFERWDEVLAKPAPPAGRDVQTALHHFARGAAYAGQGQPDAAAKELAALETAAGRVKPDVMWSTTNPTPLVLAVARADLAARIADARGGGSDAIAAWQRAVAAEDKVGYMEPPDWLFPAREGLAAAHMRAGESAQAEAVYRADLDKYRKNPRSLFGLWKALERQGKTAAAAAARKEFEAAWASADVPMTDTHLAVRKMTN
jgi:hypothetical protein